MWAVASPVFDTRVCTKEHLEFNCHPCKKSYRNERRLEKNLLHVESSRKNTTIYYFNDSRRERALVLKLFVVEIFEQIADYVLRVNWNS